MNYDDCRPGNCKYCRNCCPCAFGCADPTDQTDRGTDTKEEAPTITKPESRRQP